MMFKDLMVIFKNEPISWYVHMYLQTFIKQPDVHS
jgi:hypothetical protein